MATTSEKVLSDIKNGTYAPFYFLQGEEVYFIDLIADYIEKHALEETQKGFNQVIMYGKDHEVNDVLANARRFPMMSDRQVVIVKEAQELKDINRESGMKLLQQYAENPQPTTILVLCHKHKVLDGRKSLKKVIDKKALLVTTKKMYDNQVPAWVQQYVKDKGHKINDKALTMLLEYVGTTLAKLSNEIDKVLINFKEPITIDENIVQKYIGISKDYNVFELQKALVMRDVTKANKIAHYFEQNTKDNPIIPVIALLYGFFVKVLHAHQATDKSDQALASILKINPFFVKEYKQAVRAYSLGQTLKSIQYLHEADLQSKGVQGGTMTDGKILKEMLFKILYS